jgi:Na+/melibiose symporter-like transporter
MKPKDVTDWRERVRRETFRGKTTFFHENIESYIMRQAKANTTFRIFSHWLFCYLIAKYCAQSFLLYFPELSKYGFMSHPNYKKMGHFYSWMYLVRIPFGITFYNIN